MFKESITHKHKINGGNFMKIRNIKNNKKGITLIALIITIILMLILAGVVISLTIGDNGIIKIAKETNIKQIQAEMKEQLELKIADIQIQKTGEATLQDLDNLQIDGYTIQVEEIKEERKNHRNF